VKMPEYEVSVDGKNRKVELTRTGEKSFTVRIDGKTRTVDIDSKSFDKPFKAKVDDKSYQIVLPRTELGKEMTVKVDEATFTAGIRTPTRETSYTHFEPTIAVRSKKPTRNSQTLEGAIVAPMTGKIVTVKVKKGEQVRAGQVMCVVEAMKMENEIATSKDGVVKQVYVSEGSSVSEGEPLLIIA
jgi:biotin carboxyl carrier protein